ncbi:hypothetical protein D0Y65_005737 [Glycine soja]|uniref:Ripening-related protein n=2 Tax=Glycine subgen. Soja TaxID=1462606 RepID=A0A0R0KMT1_SOYBN|nr:hypothetical protein D0Y65_005737 [Glycine soja]
MKVSTSITSFVLLLILVSTKCLFSEAQQCHHRKEPPSRRMQPRERFRLLSTRQHVTTYKCSPAVALQYLSNDTPVVALSTGWFNNRSRCLHNITISANGKTGWPWWSYVTKTMIINNIVDASKAVWKILGVPHDQ